MIEIKLEEYVVSGSKVLLGYPRGNEIAKTSNVLSLCKDNDVNIIIPGYMYSITTTFWIGFLYAIVAWDKLHNITITGPEIHSKNILDAISVISRDLSLGVTQHINYEIPSEEVIWVN